MQSPTHTFCLSGTIILPHQPQNQEMNLKIHLYNDYLDFEFSSQIIQGHTVPAKIPYLSTRYSLLWVKKGLQDVRQCSLLDDEKECIRISGNNQVLNNLKLHLDGKIGYRRVDSFYSMIRWLHKTSQTNILLASVYGKHKVIKIVDKIDGIQELKILDSIRTHSHPNLLSFEEYFVDRNKYYYVMPYCQQGTLYSLYDQFQDEIPNQIIKRIMQQILEGIEYLHNLKIIHRDLKFDNVLLDQDHKVYIIDYGLSVQFNQTNRQQAGTIGYIAPEVFKGYPFTAKSDIFSVGVIFYKLLMNQNLFNSISENKQCKIETLKMIENENAQDLLRNMLEIDFESRYTAQDCLSHPYFTDEESPIHKNMSSISFAQLPPNILLKL